MIARLRLLLAVLVLALAPVMVPVLPLAAPAMAAPAMAAPAMADGHDPCVAHPCDTATPADHSDARCAAACGLSASLAPLLVPAGVAMGPGTAVLRQPMPRDCLLSATLWPPPVRPPRV